MDDIHSKLDKMDTKLDKLDGRLDNLEISQVGMASDLKYHIKRTNMLEDDLKPIRNKYFQLTGVLKFISAVLVLVGGIEAVIRVFWP